MRCVGVYPGSGIVADVNQSIGLGIWFDEPLAVPLVPSPPITITVRSSAPLLVADQVLTLDVGNSTLVVTDTALLVYGAGQLTFTVTGVNLTGCEGVTFEVDDQSTQVGWDQITGLDTALVPPGVGGFDRFIVVTGNAAATGATDVDLLNEVQYALLEPVDGGASWTSELWTVAEAVDYVNQRQHRLLRETLILVGLARLPMAVGQPTVSLPDDWIRTAEVVWLGRGGTVKALYRSDSFAADHLLATWTTPGTPLVYFDDDAETLTMRIAPPPTEYGELLLYFVPMGDPLARTPSYLNVPNELAPILKYGVLADMLSKEGRGRDIDRAAYAQQRFDLGVEAAQMLLDGLIGDTRGVAVKSGGAS